MFLCAVKKLLGPMHWPLIVSLIKLELARNGFQKRQELLRKVKKNVERTSMESLGGEQGYCND